MATLETRPGEDLGHAPADTLPIGSRARADLQGGRALALDVAGRALGAGFGLASRLRGGKIFHPDGVAHEGVLRLPGGDPAPEGATLLREPGQYSALVRFSRSVGLPRPITDLLGISLRLPDVHGPGAHQDILAVTSIDAPLAHHVFVPATDYQQRVYSSSLPYRSGDDTYLLGFRPVATSPRPAGRDEHERLARAAATGKLRFELCVAPLSGTFRAVGELWIGERLPPEADATRFNPWNTGGGLEPAGVLNRLRDYAYPMSQRGWNR